MEYKHAKHHVYLMNYHFVWCPKRRRSILTGKLKARFEVIVKQVLKKLKADLLALEVMPDHVHLFVSGHPTLAPHKIVKAIKGRSSRLLRREFKFLLRMPCLWTHSYFVSTAGNVSSKTIQDYIENQSKL
jgi:putative transposase